MSNSLTSAGTGSGSVTLGFDPAYGIEVPANMSGKMGVNLQLPVPVADITNVYEGSTGLTHVVTPHGQFTTPQSVADVQAAIAEATP